MKNRIYEYIDKQKKRSNKKHKKGKSKRYKSYDPTTLYKLEYYRVQNLKNFILLNSDESEKKNSYLYYNERMKEKVDERKIEKIKSAYFKSRKQDKERTIEKEDEYKPEETEIIEEKRREKVEMDRKQEIRQFKESMKTKQPKTDLDKAMEKFEQALKEKNKYDEELKKNGYKYIKGRRNVGMERE